jgi:hypothetical protein
VLASKHQWWTGGYKCIVFSWPVQSPNTWVSHRRSDQPIVEVLVVEATGKRDITVSSIPRYVFHVSGSQNNQIQWQM